MLEKKQAAEYLKQLKDLGITRVEVAKLAGTTPGMVSKVLHRKAVSATVVAAIDLAIQQAKQAQAKHK